MAGDAADLLKKLRGMGSKKSDLNTLLLVDLAELGLPEDDDILMDEIAEILLDHPEITKVRVEGHTDSDGNDAFNLDLSRRRAATVVRMLVTRGVDPERAGPAGFGESRPIAPNTDAAGKASNRRVELHIVGRDSSGTADDESAE